MNTNIALNGCGAENTRDTIDTGEITDGLFEITFLIPHATSDDTIEARVGGVDVVCFVILFFFVCFFLFGVICDQSVVTPRYCFFGIFLVLYFLVTALLTALLCYLMLVVDFCCNVLLVFLFFFFVLFIQYDRWKGYIW